MMARNARKPSNEEVMMKFLEALGDDAELSCASIEGVLDDLTELSC